MSIHDLFQNSEDEAYLDAVRTGADWQSISEILARRLVRGPKEGISPCPDQRTREACFKRSPTPPTERELQKRLKEDEYAQAYLECIENLDDVDTHPSEILRPLYENTTDGWEIAGHIGMVPKPAVYYTWTALERLSKLLSKKDAEPAKE